MKVFYSFLRLFHHLVYVSFFVKGFSIVVSRCFGVVGRGVLHFSKGFIVFFLGVFVKGFSVGVSKVVGRGFLGFSTVLKFLIFLEFSKGFVRVVLHMPRLYTCNDSYSILSHLFLVSSQRAEDQNRSLNHVSNRNKFAIATQ